MRLIPLGPKSTALPATIGTAFNRSLQVLLSIEAACPLTAFQTEKEDGIEKTTEQVSGTERLAASQPDATPF